MSGNIEFKDNNAPRDRDAVNGNSSSNSEIEENMTGLVASPSQIETDPAKQFGQESKRRHRVVLDNAILYLVLAYFGMVGSLARVGLQRLTAFEGASGGVLWANFAGCVLMGILVKSKVLFGGLLDENNHLRQRAYKLHGEIPLYIGLATGCCGSITSFSSFMLTLFELTTNQTGVDLAYPNKGYGVMAFLSYTIITMAVSGAGFLVGHHIALMLDLLLVYVDLARAELLIELAVVLSAALGYIVVIVLTIVFPNWRYWTFFLLFAPFGVYARFWCSKYLNKLSTHFMWGTFTANVSATVLISILALLSRGQSSNGSMLITSRLNCQVVNAFIDGFCGNFSTISSLIAELFAFRKVRYAYTYAGLTISISFALMVVILGSQTWTNGLAPNAIC